MKNEQRVYNNIVLMHFFYFNKMLNDKSCFPPALHKIFTWPYVIGEYNVAVAVCLHQSHGTEVAIGGRAYQAGNHALIVSPGEVAVWASVTAVGGCEVAIGGCVYQTGTHALIVSPGEVAVWASATAVGGCEVVIGGRVYQVGGREVVMGHAHCYLRLDESIPSLIFKRI